MVRPGLRLVAYASESATHVSIAASGELDYQPIFRRTSSQLGLGQGINPMLMFFRSMVCLPMNRIIFQPDGTRMSSSSLDFHKIW